MFEGKYFLFTLEKGIGTLTLNRPPYNIFEAGFYQELGEVDLKTSCWIDTPEEIRKAGGALFAERRYGKVFIFHNGADSYYSVRGFRTKLSV